MIPCLLMTPPPIHTAMKNTAVFANSRCCTIRPSGTGTASIQTMLFPRTTPLNWNILEWDSRAQYAETLRRGYPARNAVGMDALIVVGMADTRIVESAKRLSQ